MRLKIFVVGVVVWAFGMTSGFAENTRPTNPNAVGFEAFGKGLRYSVFYDRMLNDDFAAGFGYGSSSTQSTGLSATGTSVATILPMYANYYLMREAGSVLMTAGLDWVLNGRAVAGKQAELGNLIMPTTGVIFGAGAGYEYRGDYGFLFRGVLYGLYGSNFVPWFGLTFGYAF